MNTGFRETLTRETLAKILSVFFLAVGWAATRAVDQASNAPIIEYRLREATDGRTSTLAIDLENLTQAVLFKDLTLYLRLEEGSFEEESLELEPHPPAWDGDNEPGYFGASASFQLDEFHPGWRFTLRAKYRDSRDRPKLQIQGPAGPVRLEEDSWKTWFLRYQHWVIAAGLVVWLLVMLLVFRRGDKGSKNVRSGCRGYKAGTRQEGKGARATCRRFSGAARNVAVGLLLCGALEEPAAAQQHQHIEAALRIIDKCTRTPIPVKSELRIRGVPYPTTVQSKSESVFCPLGRDVQAKPLGPDYYKSEWIRCRPEIEIEVRKKPTPGGDEAKPGDFPDGITTLFLDALDLLASEDPKSARLAERKLEEAIEAEAGANAREAMSSYGQWPVYYLPHYHLGRAQFLHGDCEGALENFDRALDKRHICWQGEALKELRKAKEACERTTRRDSRSEDRLARNAFTEHTLGGER